MYCTSLASASILADAFGGQIGLKTRALQEMDLRVNLKRSSTFGPLHFAVAKHFAIANAR
jgi:hypothetical protein